MLWMHRSLTLLLHIEPRVMLRIQTAVAAAEKLVCLHCGKRTAQEGKLIYSLIACRLMQALTSHYAWKAIHAQHAQHD